MLEGSFGSNQLDFEVVSLDVAKTQLDSLLDSPPHQVQLCFLLIFMSLPRGPRWGACGSLCSLVAVRIVLIFQLDPLPLRSPTTYFSCFFQLRSSILSAIHAFLFHQKKKLFFPTGDPLMLGIADAIGGAQMPYSMAIALKQTSQINAGGSSA